MKDLSVPASFGNCQKLVRITFPNGAAGAGHIYIDKWYHGQIVHHSTGWYVYLNQKSELSFEDAEVLKAKLIEHIAI